MKIFPSGFGLPTDVELRKLTDHFGVPEARLYRFEELATTCGLSWPQDRSRLKSVLGRWRSKLKRDWQLLSEGVPGEGVKVLTEAERTPHGIRFSKIGMRKQRRGLLAISLTDLDKIADPRARAEAEHAQHVASRILPTIAQNVKALTPPPTPDALPRAR
jgi:hypothetical protein